ncbi:MAG TPA: helix-turn-helix transcriptional regulator [Pyrinomonadaceae bacterium]|nr:helix-turn-helix transcriptional regulator [Pyrinomonadaceae bacterium]
MGQASRTTPERLAEKLIQIRLTLELSQNELIKRLGLEDDLTQARISAYERSVREPPLLVLLSYARAAGVYVDVLIDDELELPLKLPARPTSEGTKRKSVSRSKAKNK